MKALFAAITLLVVSPIAADTPLCGTANAESCCKVCRKGKACGDSCIAKDRICRKDKGCACNG